MDLADLVNVLNLTNGVAEFKDTGNSVSLLKMIDSEDQIRDVLDQFDIVTQINAFDKVRETLKKLCIMIQKEASDQRYTGIREMIGTVLGERFIGEDNIDPKQLDEISDMDLKFLLTRWFFNQNRMGLGLATGLEALRDMVTPAFMTARGYDANEERIYRENAESYFITIAHRVSAMEAERTELEEVVCELGMKLRHYKDIRNAFAHSLKRSDTGNLDTIKADLNDFRNNLYRLKALFDKDNDAFNALFQPMSSTSVHTASGGDCRLVLDKDGSCPYESLKTSNSKAYDVFYLDSSVRSRIFGETVRKPYPATERAYFLYKYLKDNLPDWYENISIILYDFQDTDKEAVFRIFLECFENRDNRIKLYHYVEGKLLPCKKKRILVSMEDYQNQFMDSEVKYASIMETSLVKCP